VVRSDFSVGGYGLGGEVKLRLLRKEDMGYEEAARLKINDKALPLFAFKCVLDWMNTSASPWTIPLDSHI